LSRSQQLQGAPKTQAHHRLSRLPRKQRHLQPARRRRSPPQTRHPRTLHITAATDTITRNILVRFRSSGRITAGIIDTIGRGFTGRGSTGLSPIGTTIGTIGIITSDFVLLILSDRFDRHASGADGIEAAARALLGRSAELALVAANNVRTLCHDVVVRCLSIFPAQISHERVSDEFAWY
jgi:hypothetical protein